MHKQVHCTQPILTYVYIHACRMHLYTWNVSGHLCTVWVLIKFKNYSSIQVVAKKTRFHWIVSCTKRFEISKIINQKV